MNSPQTASLINDAKPVGTPCKKPTSDLGRSRSQFSFRIVGYAYGRLIQTENFKHGTAPPAMRLVWNASTV